MALHKTNSALRNPATACEDLTLTAVMLLTVFEVNSLMPIGPGGRQLMFNQKLSFVPSLSMDACSKHMRGAMELLKLRGSGQLETATGIHLFRIFRTYAVSHEAS